jgi:hypothetical protein
VGRAASHFTRDRGPSIDAWIAALGSLPLPTTSLPGRGELLRVGSQSATSIRDILEATHSVLPRVQLRPHGCTRSKACFYRRLQDATLGE